MVAETSSAQTKPLSRLSTIAEKAERSELSDDERSIAAGMKGKKKHVAGNFDFVKSKLDALLSDS